MGTAKIIGRVHIAQMKFGNSVFPVSITVLEKNDVDFLFGLDTLRRYRCVIDLGALFLCLLVRFPCFPLYRFKSFLVT